MPSSIRCKITGCDRDGCGVCRRCGSEKGAEHQWEEASRDRPCFRRHVCSRCEREREQPDHDWESIGGDLKCRRCGLSI